MSLIKSGYKIYEKSELLSKINSIQIYRTGNQVITKFLDRIINTTNVSSLYEVFDIRSFMISKIDQLELNFNITHYKFKVNRGIQELVLLSDSVTINDTKYYKAFFILNSSDKSRRLNLNMGLYREDNDSYLVNSIKNISLSKKHLSGVTKMAEDVSKLINVETFDEQINCIKSLIGEKVLLSNVRNIIVDKDLKINHSKFDALKNSLRFSKTDKINLFSNDQINTLKKTSEELVLDHNNDILLDAYKVFNCYIQIFSRYDSYIVKKETDKILRITQCFIRDEKINEILELTHI